MYEGTAIAMISLSCDRRKIVYVIGFRHDLSSSTANPFDAIVFFCLALFASPRLCDAPAPDSSAESSPDDAHSAVRLNLLQRLRSAKRPGEPSERGRRGKTVMA